MKQIDKGAVILTLQKMVYGDLNTVDLTRKQINALKDAIALLTVEPKRGRWMHDKDDALHAGYCSCCGWMANIAETDVADMPFCPNCGAKMDWRYENETCSD